ncbi:hypothetical protein B1812_12360 [Methylocystis bryophila]|uniref:HD domain-containing protein n=1 Tax=Methylocystis bryophila TaxID=655015 RepID=A0A1W6MW62_9HYPH|nr:hypothetical protein B1812_12360 [Methylocystis bryophila]
MSTIVLGLTRALVYAAEAHANQRRKGAAQEPYINHPIEVLDLVARATGGADEELLTAALLHDVVEDTPVTAEELAAAFGERVARIVTENSDDMTLPKDERRRRRIAAMPHKSVAARIVKTADVISNLRATAASPPAGWAMERRLGYLEGAGSLSTPVAAPMPQSRRSSTRRPLTPSGRFAPTRPSTSAARRAWPGISTASSARRCISSTCRTPRGGRSRTPTWTGSARPSPATFPPPPCSTRRRSSTAAVARSCSRASAPTAPMRWWRSPSGSASPSTSASSGSRLAGATSASTPTTRADLAGLRHRLA